MSNKEPRYHLTNVQQFFFVLLRIGIGWHFLREGWVKLSHPTWTAAGYLYGSWGPFAKYFQQIANDETLMALTDKVMPWALFLVGLGLMLGLFTRLSIIGGIVLLAMFYLAAPPWELTFVTPETMEAAIFADPSQSPWIQFESWLHHAQWAGKFMIGTEGNYVIVNKNLVELLALLALLTVNTGQSIGFDPYIRQFLRRGEKSTPAEAEPQPQPAQ